MIAVFVTVLLAVGTVAGTVSLSQRDDAPDQAPRAAQPPRPEPLVFLPIASDEARRLNAQIPFRPVGPAAKPFFLNAEGLDRARAIDCLSAAMLYEAGDDGEGQYAVAQVVLNRVRHPAFPASICGVVFEGTERATGCQFTFTCDGALARVPPLAAMGRARSRANDMLRGRVATEVGLATHYHTDWVHPAWSAQLEKIARVGTHLFFRWGNGWGTPSAMRQKPSPTEPVVAKLAPLFPAHQAWGEDIAGPTGADGDALRATIGQTVEGGSHFSVTFTQSGNPTAQALAALEKCGSESRCTIVGYLQEGSGPGPVVFSYARDRDRGLERVRWDCTRFKRPTTTQCMTAN